MVAGDWVCGCGLLTGSGGSWRCWREADAAVNFSIIVRSFRDTRWADPLARFPCPERAADILRSFLLADGFEHGGFDLRRLHLAIPRCASIIAAVRIAPKGFAMFLPAIGGAEPCTGSNIEVLPG